MRVAIVHDYIKEYGGAERVLEALTEIFPDAPIYTAFYDKNSIAYQHFKHKKIIPSWAQYVPFFASRLHSPLRFLTPFIWGSFDLSEYDLVISSASWYVTKGFKKLFNKGHFIEICYCHTPPRWLYGYATSVNRKNILIKIYAALVGHFMRMYDFESAQEVDYFIANSKETAGRIKKFYRRDAAVIYPPAGLDGRGLKMEDSNLKIEDRRSIHSPASTVKNQSSTVNHLSSKDYYLIVSRITGTKGLGLAIDTALKMGIKLKIAGAPTNYFFEHKNLTKKSQDKVEFLGHVSDEELVKLYSGAKAFLALAKDEDFGITPVEAMSCGTPVIAFNGGGYKETVLDKKTGLLFNNYSVEGLIEAIKQFNNLTINPKDCLEQAQKFSKERFKMEIKEFIAKVT